MYAVTFCLCFFLSFFTQFCFNFVMVVLLLLFDNSTKIYRLSQYSWLRILQYFSFEMNALVVAVRSWFCFFFPSSLSYIYWNPKETVMKKKKIEMNIVFFMLIILWMSSYTNTDVNWNRQSKVHVSSRLEQILYCYSWVHINEDEEATKTYFVAQHSP